MQQRYGPVPLIIHGIYFIASKTLPTLRQLYSSEEIQRERKPLYFSKINWKRYWTHRNWWGYMCFYAHFYRLRSDWGTYLHLDKNDWRLRIRSSVLMIFQNSNIEISLTNSFNEKCWKFRGIWPETVLNTKANRPMQWCNFLTGIAN